MDPTFPKAAIHTCALDDNGVSCWGANTYGENTVPGLNGPVAVFASAWRTCAIDVDTQGNNQLVCRGRNHVGQSDVPLSVVNPYQFAVGAANYSGAAQNNCIKDDIGWVCWGPNSFGALDIPVETSIKSPLYRNAF